MKNTKFRRRALVSSVAMLLVALVALGSATFAWFTDNPVASATGISGKGQTSQGLIIETDTDGGGAFTGAAKHEADLFKNLSTFTMQPALDAGSHTFLTGTATTSGNSAINTAKNWAGATDLDAASGTGVYHETIFLRTTGAGTTNTPVYLTGVEVDQQGLTNPMKNALCVAIYAGTTRIALYKASGNGPIQYTSPASGSAPVVPDPVTYESYTSFGANNGSSTSLGNAQDGVSCQVEVYVYLDGSDAAVYTDNASAADIVSSVTCHFSTVQPS